MTLSSQIVCISLIVVLGLTLSCTPKYALPKEPKIPVISLSYEGGFGPPIVNKEPSLQILADGTVKLGAPFGQKKRIETKIEGGRLQQILYFLLDKQQLQSFDPEEVSRLIQIEQRQREQVIAVEDAGTTYIHIHVAGEIIELEFNALPEMAQEFPTVMELGRLEAARGHLENLRKEIYVGGREGVVHYLNLANKHLKEENPDIPPLAAENLQNCWQFANNSTYVGFGREERINEETTRITSVTITIAVGESPQIVTNVYTELTNE